MATEAVKIEQSSTGTKAILVHDFQNCNEAVCTISLIQYSLLEEFQKNYIEKTEREKTKKKREVNNDESKPERGRLECSKNAGETSGKH